MSKKSGKPGENSSSSSSSIKPSDVRSMFLNFAASTKPKLSSIAPQQESPMKRKAVVLVESDDDSDDERMKNKKLNNGTSRKFSSLSTKSTSSLSSLSRKKALSQQLPIVVDLVDTDMTGGKSSSCSDSSSSKSKILVASNSGQVIEKNKSNGGYNPSSSSNKKIISTFPTFNLTAKSSSNGVKSLSSKAKKEPNNINNTIMQMTTAATNNSGVHNDKRITHNTNAASKRNSSVISSCNSNDEESTPPVNKKNLFEPNPSKMTTTTTTKFTPGAQNENMNESLFEISYMSTPLALSPCDLNLLNDNTKNKTPLRHQKEPWEDFHDFDSDLETPEKLKNKKNEQDSKPNEIIPQVSSSSLVPPILPQHKNIPQSQNNTNNDKIEKSKVTTLIGTNKNLSNNIGDINNKPAASASSSLLSSSFNTSLNLPTPKSVPKPSSFPVSNSNQGKHAARKFLEFNDNSPSSSSTTPSSSSSAITTTGPLLSKEITSKSTTTAMKNNNSSSSITSTSSSNSNSNSSSNSSSNANSDSSAILLKPEPKDLLWVDKYKPTKLKAVIGQGANNSCAKNLVQWLQNWFNYHGSSTDKARVRYPGLKDREGKIFKVALLSGPPGIGKTTTAHLACKELGYTFTELNASDKRNKNSFQDSIRDQLGNFECLSYFGQDVNVDGSGGDNTSASGSNSNSSSRTCSYQQPNRTMKRRHVLIMDEVDGVSGNEDRGGIQELIKLIKTSRIPIICICNDRQSQKIRSLANYCHDLRFDKPTSTQLKGLIQQICFKEKIKISPQTQEQLISSTSQDIRQIIHQLQMAKGTQSNENTEKVYNPQKDITLGPWEVCKAVFLAQEHQDKTIDKKASMFFQDYNIGPLFVQENYLSCVPIAANGNKFKRMDLIRATAQSLAYGDVVESMIRKSQNWNLLPTQAIFHSVLPGEYMESMRVERQDFPKWLGKNSTTTKRQRLLRELHSHAHLEISGSLEALNMDYLPHFKHKILQPLLESNVEDAVSFMTDYALLKDDFESIDELASFSGLKNSGKRLKYENVAAPVKSSFTRSLNKKLFLPYSIDSGITKKRGQGINEFDIDGEDDERNESVMMNVDDDAADDESEDENFEKDKMIKMKQSKGKKSSGKTTKTATTTTSAGKGTHGKKGPKGKM